MISTLCSGSSGTLKSRIARALGGSPNHMGLC
ncbi:hypothetical protein PSPO01_04333 [Paraphaeosphaeria sporulosa]